MKWNEKNVRRNVRLYYGYSLFGNLDFARGLFVLFLISRGMSTGQVGMLQTALFWSNLLAEIPAGILADKTRRRYSVSAGLIFIALASVLMIYGHSFYAFLTIFIFHGVGFALRSGADSALLYDGLKEAGPQWESRYLAITSRANGVTNIAMGAAIALGGFLFALGWDFVYWSFAVCMALGAVCTLVLSESRRSVAGETHGLRIGLFRNLSTFFKDRCGKQLLAFLLGMGFLEASHAPFFIYIQVLFKSYGLSEAWIGCVIASAMGGTALGYLVADRLAPVGLKGLVYGGSLLTSALTLGYFWKPPLVLIIALYVVIDMIPSLIFVHTDNYINQQAPSEIRATVLSVQSFISSIFISVAFLAGGFLMETFSPRFVLASLGALPILGIIALTVHFRKAPKVTEESCGPAMS